MDEAGEARERAVAAADHPGQTRELAVVEKQLVAWLAARAIGEAQPRVSNLRSPSRTGFSSETLLFDVEWHGRRESLVARLAPRDFAVFASYDVTLQAWVLRQLETTPVPVPRVRFVEEDAQWLGAPFYVMDHIEGQVPADVPPMHVAGWVAELSPSERETMWWSGVEAMARVHQVDWRALGFARLLEPARGKTPLEQQLHYYDEYFSWAVNRADYPLIENAFSHLRAHRPSEEPIALQWGDARLGNQIFRAQQCVAVLDWEMVQLGNPVADVAWWMALDRCFSEGVDVSRLAGFPDRAATLARWQALTGYDTRDFAYYEIFALFRFHIILSRIVQQMKRVGTLEADDAYDRENLVSVVLERALAALR